MSFLLLQVTPCLPAAMLSLRDD